MWQKRTLTFLRTKIVKPYFPFQSTITTTMNSSIDDSTSLNSKNVEESDVGILCYISNLPGFRGILKQRYSDFIVNEVDLDGNVVRLTSLSVPAELEEKKEEKVVEVLDKSYTSEIEDFRSLVGNTDADRLKEYIEQINSGNVGDIDPLVLSPSSDKSHRTAVHTFFKEKLKFLVTDVIDGPTDSSKCIRVRLSSGGSQNRGGNTRKRKDRGGKPFDKRGSQDWPEDRGKFLRLHLYKENKDTQETLRLIGKMLGVQPKSFGFSGTKDKRSVSTQRVTMFKQHASRLASLNEKLIGIKVGDFCYVTEGLQLGQLLGNRFTVTLRGVVADSEDTIRASADALGKYGFVNYFGLQRFGSGSIPTHLIGAALLRGEWKAAVDMILDPREGDILESYYLRSDATRKIREQYKEDNDVNGALRRLPYHMVAERAILHSLKKCPGDYLQALKVIPRTLRMIRGFDSFDNILQFIDSGSTSPFLSVIRRYVMSFFQNKVFEMTCQLKSQFYRWKATKLMFKTPTWLKGYVHSYQSFLWNHAASVRVQKYVDIDLLCNCPVGADAVVVGDLVYCKDDSSKELIPPQVECEDDSLNEADGVGLEEVLDVVPDEKNIPVKIVDEEDLLKQKYTIDDILLPLPGSRAVYPSNDVANVYHDLARKDNISLTESVHNVKEFSITSMTGGYRRVFQKPKDLEWEILKYTDATTPLADTDLDILSKSETVMNKNTAVGSEEKDAIESSEIPQTALKLSLTLPASCYATMAIRELLKTSTSVAFHKTLNDVVQ
ncbi:hypothetical protein KSS87_000168 [Heliosperma pusillum]|nr:hypothetical protein KSS87_000168 [Heliosperma pusillum]